MLDSNLKIRALRTFQGENAVYSFFISGQDIFQIADIQRISRNENAELKGENQGGGGAVIAPSSSVNNSKSSVTNTTISAPPHIDRTQNNFGAVTLAY